MATKTTKSFKSEKRDKPKHSFTGESKPKKGGKGKGAWGSADDDKKFVGEDMHAVDDKDPNWDPADVQEGKWKAYEWKPSQFSHNEFNRAVLNIREFKDKVRAATNEYLSADDIEEFKACVKELDSIIYHQDIPSIVIKMSMDKKEEEQQKISKLLQLLGKQGFLSTNQMTQGFHKLLNSVDDMSIDNPKAKAIVSEMLGAVRAAGCLDAKANEMEKNFLTLADPDAVAQLGAGKRRIQQEVAEYFSAEEFGDFRTSVKAVNPAIQFEVIKILVSTSLDRGDRQREAASKAIAALSSDVIPIPEVEKGFNILLGRLEDLHLDVPDVLRLLSCFIARALADEAIPPSFLVRADLSKTDMGSKVLEQASNLVSLPKAGLRLAGVWGAAEDDEME